MFPLLDSVPIYCCCPLLAKWMMEMATKREFGVNLKIFSDLMGTHKGNNSGRDLVFMDRSYITRVMKINSPFYKEGLKSTSNFEI